MSDVFHSARLNKRSWNFVATDRRGRRYNVNVNDDEIRRYDRYPMPVMIWFK